VRVSGALLSFDLMINRIVQELQKLDATFLDATSLIFRFLGEKIQSKAAGMEEEEFVVIFLSTAKKNC
jgi:hypothetical protein